jgi:SAM-dependent methyltransferase
MADVLPFDLGARHVSRAAARQGLRPPPGMDHLPPFDRGWRRPDGGADAYISFMSGDYSVNWSAELEQLHDDSGREHFIDVWTRQAMLERLGQLPADPMIVDLGCSTGDLLEDLAAEHPDAMLTGIDLIAQGLRKAHERVPDARLLQADVCALPLEEASVDAAFSANLLEHVPDDARALAELRRVLRPGARGVLVVPAGPSVYDYYDRFLGHVRRYARGELASKASRAGLEVLEDIHLGSVLYPPFWLVKRWNIRRHGHLEGDALKSRVAADMAGTRDSLVGRLGCRFEQALLRAGVRLPFGIRSLTVVRRPMGDAQ